jgi:hypothetical protein
MVIIVLKSWQAEQPDQDHDEVEVPPQDADLGPTPDNSQAEALNGEQEVHDYSV